MRKIRQQPKQNAHKGRVNAAPPVEIKFYRSNERPYGIFSNLYPSPWEFEGKLYPTAEHAYQAGKARKPEVRDWILSAPSPALAAMAAHGLSRGDVTPNWVEIETDRMRRVLRAKFEQHPDLRKIPSRYRPISPCRGWHGEQCCQPVLGRGQRCWSEYARRHADTELRDEFILVLARSTLRRRRRPFALSHLLVR